MGGEGRGREGKSIEAPWKLEIDLCRCSLIASPSNNLRLKTNGLNRATMSYTTSGPFIDTIPRYALIPLKLALLVSKIGRASSELGRVWIHYRIILRTDRIIILIVAATWRWSARLKSVTKVYSDIFIFNRNYSCYESIRILKSCRIKMLLFIRLMLKFERRKEK